MWCLEIASVRERSINLCLSQLCAYPSLILLVCCTGDSRDSGKCARKGLIAVEIITNKQPLFIYKTIKNKTAKFSQGHQSVVNFTERIFLTGAAVPSAETSQQPTAWPSHLTIDFCVGVKAIKQLTCMQENPREAQDLWL